MIKRGLVSRWFVSLVGILVAILAVATGALLVAAHQGDSDTYDSDWVHACHPNNNGQIKYLGADGICHNNETPIHWPATQSPSGSTLVAGTPTTTDPQQVEGQVSPGTLVTATATCPDDKVLLGGGANATTSLVGYVEAPVTLVSSYPSSTTEWTATAVLNVHLSLPDRMTVQALALCSL